MECLHKCTLYSSSVLIFVVFISKMFISRNVLLKYLTNLFYRYNKKELTNVELQEQTSSLYLLNLHDSAQASKTSAIQYSITTSYTGTLVINIKANLAKGWLNSSRYVKSDVIFFIIYICILLLWELLKTSRNNLYI